MGFNHQPIELIIYNIDNTDNNCDISIRRPKRKSVLLFCAEISELTQITCEKSISEQWARAPFEPIIDNLKSGLIIIL